MAATYFTAVATSDVSLVAATAKTVLQIGAASTQRIRLLEWGIYFLGTSAAATPVLVRLIRQSTSGTGTTLTPNAVDESISLAARASVRFDHTVEPTTGSVIDTIEVHPQFGYEKTEPFNIGREIIIGASSFLGIVATAPEVVSVRAKFRWEE